MKTTLLLVSGVLAYALIRDVIPKLFIARIAYVTAAELRG